MLDTALSFLEELRRSFRIADAVDIMLVSIMVYSAAVWFKQTASRGILVGVSLLAIVYFSARAFDMVLTSLAFQTTFAALLFALVVVFQEDLRRMFERLSAWRTIPMRQGSSADTEVDDLIESVFKMASSKTGALIVLKGKESLNRHLDSGVPLGGRLSKPLLYSLFDASSPGHDGAAIVENNRIEKFAVHLPISKNHKEIAGRGTRHSAALGLSECSDSLTIVVSEERGVVSVAETGKLKEMRSAADLKSRLARFLATHSPSRPQEEWTALIFKHGRLKIMALAAATIAWYVLAYNPDTIQRTFGVPIEYRNLAKELQLDAYAPDEVRITLSGLEPSFRFLDPSSLSVAVDLNKFGSGDFELPLSEKNIRLPANLRIYRMEPRIVRLTLRPSPTAAADAGQSDELLPK